MIENAIGVIPVPLGIAVNFTVDGKDVFIPMAVEEPSVVAAASHAAKLAKASGGFWTSTTGSMMRGQIEIVGVTDPHSAALRIYENRDEILHQCNLKDPTLVRFGGGAKDLEVHIVDCGNEPIVVIHLLIDTKDAMGANTINTMAEAVSPLMESITNGRAILRIISNLADRRLVRARTVIGQAVVGGPKVVQDILFAHRLAEFDPYRAATHNKGVMNGVSAIVLATGNDTRAVEAGAHSYAARNGRYSSLSHWEQDKNGDLVGTLEMPMAVGIVGGATKTHPVAQISLKILGVKTADELARMIAAVGLAQNLGALRALAVEGIQQGHMALHARNLAIMAGAKLEQIDAIVRQAVEEKDIRYDRITEITQQMKGVK